MYFCLVAFCEDFFLLLGCKLHKGILSTVFTIAAPVLRTVIGTWQWFEEHLVEGNELQDITLYFASMCMCIQSLKTYSQVICRKFTEESQWKWLYFSFKGAQLKKASKVSNYIMRKGTWHPNRSFTSAIIINPNDTHLWHIALGNNRKERRPGFSIALFYTCHFPNHSQAPFFSANAWCKIGQRLWGQGTCLLL